MKVIKLKMMALMYLQLKHMFLPFFFKKCKMTIRISLDMKTKVLVLAFMLFLVAITAQEKTQKGPHGGDLMSVNDVQIEMVFESYSCLFHQEMVGDKNEFCKICSSKFERTKKVKFYLLDNNLNKIDGVNVKGKVRIVFKDETESSKKIRVVDNIIWIPLGYNGLSNYQQAIVNLKINNKEYKATFGHPIIHQGHHH